MKARYKYKFVPVFCQPSRIAALLLAAVTVAPTGAASGAGEPTEHARRDENGFRVHNLNSEYQAGPTRIRVLVPQSLGRNRDQPYRVLYVLPVEARDEIRYGDGLLECERRGIHERFQLICVAPTFTALPWYADHATDSRILQETYFIRAVLPLVEREYPALSGRKGRLLVGFSKSGWGAFSLLLRHPELFDRAAAWDAPLMMTRPDRYGMGPIFGTQENFEEYEISRLLKANRHDLTARVRLIQFGYGNFRDHHRRAHALMSRLGILHRYQDGPPREHTWHSGWLPVAVEMLIDS